MCATLKTMRMANPRGVYCNERSRRVGLPQSDPPGFWGDSLFLGLRGRGRDFSPALALLLLALGIPSVSSH